MNYHRLPEICNNPHINMKHLPDHTDQCLVPPRKESPAGDGTSPSAAQPGTPPNAESSHSSVYHACVGPDSASPISPPRNPSFFPLPSPPFRSPPPLFFSVHSSDSCSVRPLVGPFGDHCSYRLAFSGLAYIPLSGKGAYPIRQVWSRPN